MNPPVLRPIQAISELGLSQAPERLAFEAPPSELRLLVHGLSAGFPSPAGDYVEDALDLNQYLIQNKPATFLFTVRGESMIDAGILDGDYVIIRKGDTANSGEIVVALVEGEEATLKRLRKRGASIALEPCNAAYETRIFGPDQVEVQGKLVGLFRRYH